VPLPAPEQLRLSLSRPQFRHRSAGAYGAEFVERPVDSVARQVEGLLGHVTVDWNVTGSAFTLCPMKAVTPTGEILAS
jgi:hypothetical protein